MKTKRTCQNLSGIFGVILITVMSSGCPASEPRAEHIEYVYNSNNYGLCGTVKKKGGGAASFATATFNVTVSTYEGYVISNQVHANLDSNGYGCGYVFWGKEGCSQNHKNTYPMLDPGNTLDWCAFGPSQITLQSLSVAIGDDSVAGVITGHDDFGPTGVSPTFTASFDFDNPNTTGDPGKLSY